MNWCGTSRRKPRWKTFAFTIKSYGTVTRKVHINISWHSFFSASIGNTSARRLLDGRRPSPLPWARRSIPRPSKLGSLISASKSARAIQASQSAFGEPTQKRRAEDELAQSVLADTASAPVVKGTQLTEGYNGLKLAVINLDASGNGGFQLLAVLPEKDDQIRRMLAKIARKQQRV